MSVKDMKRLMSAAAMSEKEMQDFLSSPRIARLATIQNGNPHIVPVWYFYDGKNIIISTPKGTKKVRNLQSNPNVSIVIDIIDGKAEDISYATKAKAVIIEGVAELQEDIDNSFVKKTYERYVGKNGLNDPMVQFSVNLPRYMVVIRPTKIISWDFTRDQTKVRSD